MDREKTSFYKKAGLLVILNTVFSFIFAAFDSRNPFFGLLKPVFKALSGFVGKIYIFPPIIFVELLLFRLELKEYRALENKTLAARANLAVAFLRVSAISVAITGGAIAFLVGSVAFSLATPVLFVAALSLVGLGSLIRFATDSYFYFKHTVKPTLKGYVQASGQSLLNTATLGVIVFSVGKLFLAPALGLGLLAAVASPLGIAAAALATLVIAYQIYKYRYGKPEPKQRYQSTKVTDYHFSIEERLKNAANKTQALKEVIQEQKTYLTKRMLMDETPSGRFARLKRKCWIGMTSIFGLQQRWRDQLNVLERVESQLEPSEVAAASKKQSAQEGGDTTQNVFAAIERFKAPVLKTSSDSASSGSRQTSLADRAATDRIFQHCKNSFFSHRPVVEQIVQAYNEYSVVPQK